MSMMENDKDDNDDCDDKSKDGYSMVADVLMVVACTEWQLITAHSAVI